MSTRGAYGFIKNKQIKATYNHFDSYLEGLGQTMVDFIKSTSIKELNEICDRIILVNESDIPSISEKKKINKFLKENGLENPYNSEMFGSGEKDWYYYLNPVQGKPEYFKKGLNYMTNGNNFLEDTLFCEYAYLIDLDDNRFLIQSDDRTVNYPIDNIPENWIADSEKKLENKCKNKFMNLIFDKNYNEQNVFLNDLGIENMDISKSNVYNYYEQEKLYNNILEKYGEEKLEELLDNYIKENSNEKEEVY